MNTISFPTIFIHNEDCQPRYLKFVLVELINEQGEWLRTIWAAEVQEDAQVWQRISAELRQLLECHSKFRILLAGLMTIDRRGRNIVVEIDQAKQSYTREISELILAEYSDYQVMFR